VVGDRRKQALGARSTPMPADGLLEKQSEKAGISEQQVYTSTTRVLAWFDQWQVFQNLRLKRMLEELNARHPHPISGMWPACSRRFR